MKVPKAVKIMGPNSSRQDLDHAAHEHVFECRSRCPSHKTPGDSALFPTEHEDSSEWIVAWHAMKSIEKAMSFLRTNISAVTRDAVMKNPEVAKMFDDAATIVRDRLKARPQDSASLQVPGLSTESDVEEPSHPIVIHDDDFDEEDDDEEDVFFLGHGRPRPQQLDFPPAQRVAHQRVSFDEEVQFVMDATGCNRRAAIDALHTHTTADEAILWLLNR
jgi:hypothetical protein